MLHICMWEAVVVESGFVRLIIKLHTLHNEKTVMFKNLTQPHTYLCYNASIDRYVGFMWAVRIETHMYIQGNHQHARRRHRLGSQSYPQPTNFTTRQTDAGTLPRQQKITDGCDE